MVGAGKSPRETHFAPADRADAAALNQSTAELQASPLVAALIEAIPAPAFVLNPQRQIVLANGRALRMIGDAPATGQRPGELLGCLTAQTAPSGCGTAADCATCGAVNAILESLSTRLPAQRECRVRTACEDDGGALEFDVQASFVALGESNYVVVALRDVSDEKRRRVLERVFFHDVLNTAGGLLGLAGILSEDSEPEVQRECTDDLCRLAEQLVEEIQAQRQLLAAESGELRAELCELDAAALVREVVAAYRHHDAASRRTLAAGELAEVTLLTDAVLLRRVLGNLVKNALEATSIGGLVRVDLIDRGHEVELAVHNPGVISRDVQAQLFQRSFSTKGGFGRGIGAFSVRLFTEWYLGGRVSFTSDGASGTTFRVTLPKQPA